MGILVTGGAGYIGSHTVHELVNQNFEVVVLDTLELGHRESLPPKVKFIQGSTGDTNLLDKIFAKNNIDAVMHFSAYALVEESEKNPLRYYENNVGNGIRLIRAMLRNKVYKIIFSSTAAVYGNPEKTPIQEDHPLKPINHYGKSKLMYEQILNACQTHGLKPISLRYFNAAGAAHNIGEDHNPETHLIPLVLKTVLKQRPAITIFGTDYPTKDGTCVRDYIHVTDLARAHILALKHLDTHSGKKYNLGTNTGHSVKEVIELCKRITNIDIPVHLGPRRQGDPPVLVASNEKIKKELGWEPKLNIQNIIASAWEWHSTHPNGFEKT